MEIIPLMLIAVIILFSSFPAPIKVAGRGAGAGGGGTFGGTSGAFGSGTPSGAFGSGTPSGASGSGTPSVATGNPGFGGGYKGWSKDGSHIGTGYMGGASNGKPTGGGDTGPAIVVIPKKPEEPAKKKVLPPMPQECKQEVRDCINAHIHEGAGAPTYRGQCCLKLNKAVPCVCKYLTSHDPKLSKGANDVLRGCHFTKTKCSKVPMPQVCRPEARHCIDSHIYGGLGAPQHRGPCCEKFRPSKKCICTFVNSKDPHLSRHAKGVIRGCRFTKANCTI